MGVDVAPPKPKLGNSRKVELTGERCLWGELVLVTREEALGVWEGEIEPSHRCVPWGAEARGVGDEAGCSLVGEVWVVVGIRGDELLPALPQEEVGRSLM